MSLRQRPHLNNQTRLLQLTQIRLAQRTRRKYATAQLVRQRLLSRQNQSRLRETDTCEIVHAAVPAHAAVHTLGVVRVRDVGVGDGAPFDEFLFDLSEFRISEAAMGITDSNINLLFRWALARLVNEFLQQPPYWRQNKRHESRCQRDVECEARQVVPRLHVRAEPEVGSVKSALIV